MRISDWSSDVCSSDLEDHVVGLLELDGVRAALQDRPRRAHRTVPAERHRVARRAAVPAADDDVTVVGRAAVDQDHVAGFEVDAVDEGGKLGVVAPGGADGVGRGMYRAGQKKCKGNPERIESKAHLRGSVLQPPACGTIPSGSRGPATHSGRWTVLRNSSHYFACNRDVAAGNLNFSHKSTTLNNTRSRTSGHVRAGSNSGPNVDERPACRQDPTKVSSSWR